MPLRIVPFEDAHWPGLARFLHEHWQADHPLCDRDLFDWQYRGFGPAAGVSACRVAVDGERIVGFLGAIPGVYRLRGEIAAGVALALWVVVEELRNSGLGMLLMREAERQATVTVCLGVSPKVLRYYTDTGYAHLAALHRYVRPLEAEGYLALLPDSQAGVPSDQHGARDEEGGVAAAVRRWCESGEVSAAQASDPVRANGRASPVDAAETPTAIDPPVLAALWRNGGDTWDLILDRTEEFWAWRYRVAGGFDYSLLGGAGRGAVVARLDRIEGADRADLADRLVLRVIEIVPGGDGLRGIPDGDASAMVSVLTGALAWARRQGAIAADFQCSSRRLESWLTQAGFRRRVAEDLATHLPELFNPLRRQAAPINLVAKVGDKRPIDFDATYFVKSDGDMDRVVRW